MNENEISQIKKELEKMRYHISLLSETISFSKHPVQSLVIDFDWGKEELNTAHDVFEKYDGKIREEEEDISWVNFRYELEKSLGIDYQSIKMLVLAFFRNGQWQLVCREYAKNYKCAEFDNELYEME